MQFLFNAKFNTLEVALYNLTWRGHLTVEQFEMFCLEFQWLSLECWAKPLKKIARGSFLFQESNSPFGKWDFIDLSKPSAGMHCLRCCELESGGVCRKKEDLIKGVMKLMKITEWCWLQYFLILSNWPLVELIKHSSAPRCLNSPTHPSNLLGLISWFNENVYNRVHYNKREL